jgi:hypothetical protein
MIRMKMLVTSTLAIYAKAKLHSPVGSGKKIQVYVNESRRADRKALALTRCRIEMKLLSLSSIGKRIISATLHSCCCNYRRGLDGNERREGSARERRRRQIGVRGAIEVGHINDQQTATEVGERQNE